VPIAWVKTYGEGKIFYTNLGHNTETWANKQFIESLLGGIKWVMGLEEGDATPNPEVSKAQEEKAKADAPAGTAGDAKPETSTAAKADAPAASSASKSADSGKSEPRSTSDKPAATGTTSGGS
jgi:hypothetical protein